MDKNIVLIGMMGSGKTSVGKVLAKKLDVPFVDIDTSIQEKTRKTPAQIFAQHGEEFFRTLERAETVMAAAKTPQVISTGGGCVLNQNSMMALKRNGVIVFLNRPVDAIAGDVDFASRPLLNSPDDIFKIHAERLPLYEKYADFTLHGDISPDDAVLEILRCIQNN